MSDWRVELDDFFSRQEQLEQAEAEQQSRVRQDAAVFLAEIVVPAFEQLKAHLSQHGRVVKITPGDGQATITVIFAGSPEIMYRIYADMPQPVVRYAYIDKVSGKAVKSTDALTSSAAMDPVPSAEITQEVIIQHFIRKYKSV